MDMITGRNQEAFTEFYRRYAPGLFAMIYQILNEQKEAEDTLQEALVQIWKKAETYDAGRSSVFTWAVMIARHRAIDRVRARVRRQNADQTIIKEFETRPQTDSETAEKNAEQQDEKARIRQALGTLPDNQREAIECAFFSGLTHEEVAQRLAAPLGTIKARIRRGLLALREALQSL